MTPEEKEYLKNLEEFMRNNPEKCKEIANTISPQLKNAYMEKRRKQISKWSKFRTSVTFFLIDLFHYTKIVITGIFDMLKLISILWVMILLSPLIVIFFDCEIQIHGIRITKKE